MSAERKKMEGYLEEKYGQEFVVNNVRVTGGGLGVKGSIRGDAYPMKDPSLKFEIRKPQDYKDPNFYDFETFLEVLWSRQAQKEIDNFIKNSISDIKEYTVNITPSSKLQDSIQGYTPSFPKIKLDFPDEYSYNLSVMSATTPASGEPSVKELNRAFDLLLFVRSQHASYSELNYYYSSSNVNQNAKKGFIQYQFHIEDSAVETVKQPKDLRAYFTKEFISKGRE